MKKEKFWSQYASDFEERNTYVVGQKDMDIVLENVKQLRDLGETLELACGNGTYTKELLKNSKTVKATDFSEEMVAETKKRFIGEEKVKVEQANGLDLPYEEESFDTVFLANFLHVTENCGQVLEQIKKVLKPGGRVIAIDFTIDGMTLIAVMKMISRFKKAYGTPLIKPEQSKFTVGEMRKRFEEKGFTVEEAKIIGTSSKAILGVGRK